jgi:hypothetical protein
LRKSSFGLRFVGFPEGLRLGPDRLELLFEGIYGLQGFPYLGADLPRILVEVLRRALGLGVVKLAKRPVVLVRLVELLVDLAVDLLFLDALPYLAVGVLEGRTYLVQ